MVEGTRAQRLDGIVRMIKRYHERYEEFPALFEVYSMSRKCFKVSDKKTSEYINELQAAKRILNTGIFIRVIE